MEFDDPFTEGSNNHTVIIPNPGGKLDKSAGRSFQPEQDPFHDQRSSVRERSQPTYAEPLSSACMRQNPMLAAAHNLLILGFQLSSSLRQDNVGEIRERVSKLVQNFDISAKQSGYGQSDISVGRFLLCAYLDECVLTTPWGSSEWSSQTLTSRFFKQRGSGENFFLVIDKLLKEGADKLHLIELASVCISFGFKGKYRLSKHGDLEVQEIQEKLTRTIASNGRQPLSELSPPQNVQRSIQNRLTRYVPFWVFAAVAGLLLFIIFVGFKFILEQSSGEAVEQTEQLKDRITQEATISTRKLNGGLPGQ